MHSKKIGFIGLGIMGHSMAHNLIRAGYKLVVFNRTKSRAESLLSLGAELADSAADLLTKVDICCSCVTDSDVLFEIIEQIRSSLLPKYWLDFSTISPSAAVRLHQKLKSLGVYFIDSPVTGGDIGARNATLTIMVGAEQKEFTEMLPIFSVLGKNIVHVGNTGAGQLTKCVNQLMVAISIAAMSEGLVFAEKSGLDIEKTLSVVKGGAAGSWALDNYAPRLLRGEYGPGFYARDMLKDLNFVITEAETLGLKLPATELMQELFHKFVSSEGRDLGNHALIKAYR